MQPGSMDTLLAKLSEQQALLTKQQSALSPISALDKKAQEDSQAHADKQIKVEKTNNENSSTSPSLLTPASESSGIADEGDATIKIEAVEMSRLKKELDAAKSQIARQKQELDQTRVIKHTFDQAVGPPSDTALSPNGHMTDSTHFFVPSNRSLSTLQTQYEDVRSDSSDPPGSFNPAPNVWSNVSRPAISAGFHQEPGWGQSGHRLTSQRGMGNGLPAIAMPPQQAVQTRNYSMPVSPQRGNGRSMNEFSQFNHGRTFGLGNPQNSRNSSVLQRSNGWDVYAGGPGPMDDMNLSGMTATSTYNPMGAFPPSYQPRPIGTPLSPTAAEFRAGSQAPTNPWNNAVSHCPMHATLTCIECLTLLQPPSSPGQTYVSPMEPLNYRRLLDRSVTCNWKYIVDKIVCNNDQQASIFLQQKLKVGTVEQKFEIIEAIVAQAYPLMVNRFGNFLVQRCFEHGTPEQVIAIANAIRGNTLSLSMDAFGCHVVQKAFDAVPEDYKAIMVHELLRRIPETVIHRYACHVWQKLFELRWSDSPPQIMRHVNEALCGMWHEVALGETGSLVVQNIFENCLEEDKVCPTFYTFSSFLHPTMIM